MVIKEVTIDEVHSVNVILYNVRVSNVKIEALCDTGASIIVMSHRFYNLLENNPKLIKCNRSFRSRWGSSNPSWGMLHQGANW